jgi:hypothetical protein
MQPPLTFIRAAEVWLPSEDGSLLEFGAGAFGTARRFAALSRSMCFGRGEGLPGRAWDEGRPLLLRQFEGSYFQRTAAARAAGLSCAIAMPIFVGGGLKAVLVVFCGHLPGRPDALELWHADPRVTTDMTLVDGAYGDGLPDFEAASRETYLPRGTGLPGLAWQHGEAQFMEDLVASPARFVRAEQAAEAGMRRGLGIPLGARTEGGYVVTFLAGAELPLAQAIERWTPNDDRTRLVRLLAFSEQHGGRSKVSAELTLSGGMAHGGAIERAWTTGVPAINDSPSTEPGAPAAVAAAIGSTALLAVPVALDDGVVEVIALYL